MKARYGGTKEKKQDSPTFLPVTACVGDDITWDDGLSDSKIDLLRFDLDERARMKEVIANRLRQGRRKFNRSLTLKKKQSKEAPPAQEELLEEVEEQKPVTTTDFDGKLMQVKPIEIDYLPNAFIHARAKIQKPKTQITQNKKGEKDQAPIPFDKFKPKDQKLLVPKKQSEGEYFMTINDNIRMRNGVVYKHGETTVGRQDEEAQKQQ